MIGIRGRGKAKEKRMKIRGRGKAKEKRMKNRKWMKGKKERRNNAEENEGEGIKQQFGKFIVKFLTLHISMLMPHVSLPWLLGI